MWGGKAEDLEMSVTNYFGLAHPACFDKPNHKKCGTQERLGVLSDHPPARKIVLDPGVWYGA
jgi:hypothetical protein